MQGANWDTMRALARDFAEIGFKGGENVFGITDAHLEGNGVTFVFDDGSEGRFEATITKDGS